MRLSGLLIFILMLSACATPPEPCNCAKAEQELEGYALKYFDALEDKGNLRHQLKACQERKP